MVYQSINPYDGSVLRTYEHLADKDLETALIAAAQCLKSWSLNAFAERALVARTAAAIMRANVDEFARPVTLETGKLIARARCEVQLSADILDYYANRPEPAAKPLDLEPQLVESGPVRLPGVIFGVHPWNSPYHQLAQFAAFNLLAGNVVMVRLTGCQPQCAIAFEKLWREAGAPAGAYTNLIISHDQASRVIDDPRVDGVALTDSVDAGERIFSGAGQDFAMSAMAHADDDVFLVLEEDDIDRTVDWAVRRGMNAAGQCRVAAKRFIVVEPIADRFRDHCRTVLTTRKPGNPMNESTTLAPLPTEAALINQLEQIERAVAMGATLITGGRRINRPGWFMQATILTDIAPDNPAFKEEFLEPVVLLFRVGNEHEARQLADDRAFRVGSARASTRLADKAKWRRTGLKRA